jgi:hypothetical protein
MPVITVEKIVDKVLELQLSNFGHLFTIMSRECMPVTKAGLQTYDFHTTYTKAYELCTLL